MDAERHGVQLTVVGAGEGVASWCERLAHELERTGHLAVEHGAADGLVVVVGPSFTEEIAGSAGCLAAVRSALAGGKVVLPVTVGGATPPTAVEVPEGIAGLARVQALALARASDVPGAVARLVDAATSVGRGHQASEGIAHRVFISYRRDDSWYWASLLATALIQRLGAPNVFFDLGSIAPGRRFDTEIRERLRAATDVVVLVGQDFLGRDASGRRRIDDPDDFVRGEIAEAVELGTRIRVVLTGGAALPDASQLPAAIAPAFRAVTPARLDEHEQVAALADDIVADRPSPSPSLGRPGPSLGRLRSPIRPFASTRTKEERFLACAVPHLSEHGWRPLDPAQNRGVLGMARPGADTFRFVFDFGRFDLVLEERAGIVSSLGLGWVERARFPFGLDEADTGAIVPPDRLVEAMVDPAAYLQRVGRLDLRRLPTPPKGLPGMMAFVRGQAQPGPTALAQHAREREQIRARGGLSGLDRVALVSLGDGVAACGVAFSPVLGQFVVASSDGLFVVDPAGGAPQRLPVRGDLLTVAVAPNGRIATTNRAARIAMLEPDGSEIMKWKSPESWRTRRGGLHRHFATPSWNDDGTRVAIGGSDRIWIYDVEARTSDRRPLRGEGDLMIDGAPALFVPGSDDLLVLQRWRVWRMARASGEVLAELDTSVGSRAFAAHDDVLFSRGSHPLGFLARCLAVSPDARHLALGGNDAQLVFLDSSTLQPCTLHTWHRPLVGAEVNGAVEALAYRPDGSLLASVANDDRLVIGDAERGDPLAEAMLSTELAAPYSRTGRRVSWSADGARVAVTNGEGRIEIFATESVPTDGPGRVGAVRR